jgi:hypothetical protein
MDEELYKKLSDAIEDIPFDDWMSADNTLEERELARQKYVKQWAKVCEDHGVTVLAYDQELARRLHLSYEKKLKPLDIDHTP